jgi:hypothetical protein
MCSFLPTNSTCPHVGVGGTDRASDGPTKLKEGGTKNLDLVTNGLESWVNESGEAMGRFVGSFIDGKQNSYKDILKASQFTGFGYSWGQDALRVVDGELDNKYKPTTTPIIVR